MQSVFVIITKLIASKHYFCKEVFCNNFGRGGTSYRIPQPHPCVTPLRFGALRTRKPLLASEEVREMSAQQCWLHGSNVSPWWECQFTHELQFVTSHNVLSVNSPALICQRIPAFSWLKLAKIGSKSAQIG